MNIIKNVFLGEYGPDLALYGQSFVIDDKVIENFKKKLPVKLTFNSEIEREIKSQFAVLKNANSETALENSLEYGQIVDIHVVKTTINTKRIYADIVPNELCNGLLYEGTKFSLVSMGKRSKAVDHKSTFNVDEITSFTIDNNRRGNQGEVLEWKNSHEFSKLKRELDQ